MSVETHRVLMGTCGWNHKAWLNNYYSEDLPEDWQLGFYSNEFPVVYMATEEWVNNEDLFEWTEDVSENFRFVLEISGDILDDEPRFINAVEKATSLNEFLLGLVFQLTPKIYNDTALFEQRLSLIQAAVPICIDAKGIALSSEFDSLLSKHNISEVWDGKSDKKESFQRGSLAISHVSGNELDMASLRRVVEHCLSVSNERSVSVLCLDGDPPSLEMLRNADIILSLL
jgi:hypothetical protein